jgi:ATP-dependent Lon protease
MKVPIYFLENNPEDVFFPGSTSYLDIAADKIKYFSTTSQKDKQYVILAYTNKDPVSLYKSSIEVEDLFHIGLFAEVIEREMSDTFFVITLNILQRTLVRNIKPVRDSITGIYTLWAIHEGVSEVYTQTETKLETDANNLIKELLTAYPQKFEAVQHKLNSNIHTLYKLFYLADKVLKDKSRMLYLQELENSICYNILTSSIHEDLASSLELVINKPKVKKVYNQKETKEPLSIKDQVSRSAMPPDVKEKVMFEVARAEQLPKGSTEYAHCNDYLRWVLSVPWGINQFSKTDLKTLHHYLDKTHYGLSDVKDHLLEILCVQEIKNSSQGTVMCFTGPAGTGKTTIAKAIADVSNRKLIRIALGGLSDTSELRGHRRTYIGSRPGRIVAELKDKKTLAPLILLDEIDKLAHYKGDPAAALLEILDPEQNDHFIDHYLEVPIDLSKAMFVCTANYEDKIPGPLIDRMELIRFRSYTKPERTVIVNQFLLPKLIKEYNCASFPIIFTDQALDSICDIVQIRQAEKILAKLLRKAITAIHVYEASSYTIDIAQVALVKNNYTEEKKSLLGFKHGN